MFNNKKDNHKRIKKKLYTLFLVVAMLLPLIGGSLTETLNDSYNSTITAYADDNQETVTNRGDFVGWVKKKLDKHNKHAKEENKKHSNSKNNSHKKSSSHKTTKTSHKKPKKSTKGKKKDSSKGKKKNSSNSSSSSKPSSSDDSSSSSAKTSGPKDSSKGLHSKKKLTHIQKLLWTQANIFNANVPAGAQATYLQRVEYDPDMQVLITYSILRNGAFYTGTKGYASLYDNGKHDNGNPKDLIEEFNNQNIGYTLPKSLGNQKLLKDLAHYKSTNKQMSKSDQVTSAAPDGDNKNTANSDDDGAHSEAKKVGKFLAEQTLKASALSNSRNPIDVRKNETSYDTSGSLRKNHAVGSQQAHEFWDWATHKKFNGTHAAQYTIHQLNGEATNSITHGAYYNYLVQLGTEYANNQIKMDAGKSGSAIKKDLQGINAGSFAAWVRQDPNRSKSFSEVSGYPFAKVFGSTITIPIEGSDVKGKTKYLNLWALPALPSGDFRNHSQSALGKSYNGNLDSNTLNKVAEHNKTAAAQDAKDVGNDKAIGWNWIAPRSIAWTPNKLDNRVVSKDTAEHGKYATNGNGLLLYAKKKDPIQVSTAALAMPSQKGDKGYNTQTGQEFHAFNVNWRNSSAKYPVYGWLDGNPDSKKVEGGALNIAMHSGIPSNTTDNSITNSWRKVFQGASFGSIGVNDEVLGYDTYGNLIDGQKGPHVVIPYWQNWTIKQFSNPSIKTGPNGFGSSSFSVSKVNAFLKSTGNSKGTGGTLVSDVSQNNFGSGSNLSKKQAAELAVAISAETQNKVKSFNQQMVGISRQNQELYVGKSAPHQHNHAGKSGSGTYLYTATDIIQRAGLATDYGFFDSIRKTIVAGLVNTYNNGFIQSGQQDIFHTTTSSETGVYNNLGLLPFYLVTAVLGIVYLWILFNQVILHRYELGRDSKRYLTALLKVILAGMLFVANPLFDNWFLNKPGEIMINKSLKQESVLDQWSDLRQEQSINNVLYSGLFGETFGQINTSQSYTLKFYTTTYKGSNAQDKQNNQGPNTKAVNDKSADSRDALKTMSDNQKAALKGNGNVGLMAPYQYKTVNIAATDLLSWAAHMDRQLKTAQQESGQTDANGQQVTGYQGTEMQEKPNGNYAPGQTPLFVWLDKYYQPLGTRAHSRGDKKYGTTVEGTSYGSGDSAYGKRRNPADTSLKSAYRTGLARNQENDNGDKYKGLSKYTEFAVNTKHYATDLDKQYGIDQDSANKANTDIQDNKTVDGKTGGSQGQSNGNTDPSTMLTASQLFLRIWETTFSTIGTNQNDPNNNTDNKANQYGESTKGVENYNALAKFAAAMRGMPIDTGDDDSGNAQQNPAQQAAYANGADNTASQVSAIKQGDVGAVGRRDLINELSMTTAQRAANNGGDGSKFSKAASQVIDAFGIPKPTHDWLNLEDDNSPLDVLHPYYGKKQSEVRDGMINKINKKFLNDYVNTYSTVRFETDNVDADSDSSDSKDSNNQNNASDSNSDQQATNNDKFDSSGNNNGGDEDSFSMAEAHMLALNEFFTINKVAHERMFPQRFTPSSVSLDSWNRMLLIPIAQMKQRDDNSQYDIWEDKVNPASIALQDNVAEYIGLRSTIPALFMFIVMNIALIIFGKLLSFMIAIVFPILLIFSLIRAFFKKDTKISNIIFGALACKVILGIMKFILIFTYAYMSSSMNNAFVNSNGQMTLPVLQNCSIITLEIVLFFLFLIKVYMPAVGRSVLTFGAMGGTAFGLAGLMGNMRANGRSMIGRFRGISAPGIFRGGIHGLRAGVHTLMNAGRGIAHLPGKAAVSLGAISGHIRNIRHAMKNGKMTSANVIRDIHSRSWRDNLSAGKQVLMDHFHSPQGILAQRINNLENAYHTGFNRVYKYGTPQEVIDGAPNGALLQSLKHVGKLSISLRDMPNFSEAQLPAIKKLIDSGEVHGIVLNGDHLVFSNATADMLKTADGRQKLVQPLTLAIQKALDSTTMRFRANSLRTPMFGSFDGTNGQVTVGVGNDMDVNPAKYKDFLSDMNVAGWKLANNVAKDANGNILSNQKLHFVPKNKMSNANMQKFYNSNLQRIIGDYLASNAAASARHLAVNAGTPENAKNIAKHVKGATVVGSQVLVGRAGAEQLNRTLNDMNGVIASDHKMFGDLGKGLVDYSHGGNGHGFSDIKFTADKNGDQITQFRNNNAQAMQKAFNAARSISGKNAYGAVASQARNAADRWDKEFAKANGNNVFQQTKALQSAMQNTNTFKSLNKHQRQLISNMNSAARNFSFNNLTDKQKAKAINDYQELVDGLQRSANWNTIQNEISSNSPSQALHAANDAQAKARSTILGMSPDGQQMLGDMGTRELVETLNTLSDLKMNDNSNGVTELSGSLSDAGIKRVQRLIQRLN